MSGPGAGPSSAGTVEMLLGFVTCCALCAHFAGYCRLQGVGQGSLWLAHSLALHAPAGESPCKGRHLLCCRLGAISLRIINTAVALHLSKLPNCHAAAQGVSKTEKPQQVTVSVPRGVASPTFVHMPLFSETASSCSRVSQFSPSRNLHLLQNLFL